MARPFLCYNPLMTNNRAFMASIERFEQQTAAKMRKIALASMLDLFNDAQNPVAKGGSMPVDTSNLRNSFVIEINGSQVGEGGDSYVLGINGFQIGDIVQGAWGAPYAMRINYGFSGEDSLGRTYNYTGTMFRDKAAAKWQNIVSKNARAAR